MGAGQLPRENHSALWGSGQDLQGHQCYAASHSSSPQLLIYEVGFLVCVAIGLLFIIFVPLVGCCFCCCRCCGNCGGRMYQKQDRRTGCRRQALWVSVLLVSALLL